MSAASRARAKASPAYRYAAVVTAVHDGDTLTADVDLGYHIWLRGQCYRLTGCNTRELAQDGGVEARDALAGLLVGARVALTSVQPDKYGDRWDAVITLADGTDLVDWMVSAGWAVRWNGRGAKPLPVWPRPAECFALAAP